MPNEHELQPNLVDPKKTLRLFGEYLLSQIKTVGINERLEVNMHSMVEEFVIQQNQFPTIYS